MAKLKSIAYLFLALIIVLLVIYFQDITYGLTQAKGQLKIIWNTKKISELKEDANTPAKWIEKLALIEEIKNFAQDSLGLEVGENYSSFYDQKGKAILWNVTASPEFEIKAYQWKFPLVGSFPYKGFFDKKKAIHEQKQLDKQGYDTRISEVSAWSTLGILNDPVLSSMLNRSAGKLAELIIHESTHSTIYLKNNVQFNENIASFIGRKGAEKFLNAYFGEESSEMLNYQRQLTKSEVYRSYMQQAISKLKTAYKKMDTGLSLAEKRALKLKWINNLKEGLKATSYYKNDSIAELRLSNYHPNNAYFSGFSTYAHRQDDYEKLLKEKFNRNLKQMVDFIRENERPL